jgi:hypothetical protein
MCPALTSVVQDPYRCYTVLPGVPALAGPGPGGTPVDTVTSLPTAQRGTAACSGVKLRTTALLNAR